MYGHRLHTNLLLAVDIVLEYVSKNTGSSATSLHSKSLARQLLQLLNVCIDKLENLNR